jgi:hypothetical protein
MITIIMMELVGCAGYTAIPKTSLPDYSHYKHIVYGEDSKYILDSTVISDGMLLGVIDLKQSRVKNAIKVYPLPFPGIVIDTMNILMMPVDNIGKVKAPGIYIPKEIVYTSSKHKSQGNKEPAGKIILKSLYFLTGLMVTSSLAWWIFEQKRH